MIYRIQRSLLFTLGLVLSLGCQSVVAEEFTIAVASNFTSTLEKIRQEFEASTEHRVTVVSGSSGRLFAQISNGAPFDLFLSADAQKPQALEEAGLIGQGQRSVYALGRLALYSNQADMFVEGPEILRSDTVKRLAIANPRVAPYGAAAISVLTQLGLEEQLRPRLVQGENIAQAYQFVDSGNAQLGFVALSQVLDRPESGSYWEVPAQMHAPLVQELAVVKDGEGVRAFLVFLKRSDIRALIARSGYELPPHS